ncbi:MAG: aldehyde dehydrogenase family protein, partial [Acidimicrobiia bacterium]
MEHAVVNEPIIQRGLMIGGKELEAADGSQLEITNPATGNIVARVAAAGELDIDTAVTVARESFDSGVWSSMPIWD